MTDTLWAACDRRSEQNQDEKGAETLLQRDNLLVAGTVRPRVAPPCRILFSMAPMPNQSPRPHGAQDGKAGEDQVRAKAGITCSNQYPCPFCAEPPNIRR